MDVEISRFRIRYWTLWTDQDIGHCGDKCYRMPGLVLMLWLLKGSQTFFVGHKTQCPRIYIKLHGLMMKVIERFPQNITCYKGALVFEKQVHVQQFLENNFRLRGGKISQHVQHIYQYCSRFHKTLCNCVTDIFFLNHITSKCNESQHAFYCWDLIYLIIIIMITFI